MNSDYAGVGILLTLAAVIIGGHLLVSAIIWRRFPTRVSLLRMLFLAIPVAIVWNYGGYAVCFFMASDVSASGTPRQEVCRATFALAYRVCEIFPSELTCGSVAPLFTLLLATVAFLLLSLSVVPFVRKQEAPGE